MDLKTKYGQDYILLAGLRQFIEEGIMLASVNFWRDSIQNYKELDIEGHREFVFNEYPDFRNCEFLNAFMNEQFPNMDEKIPEDVVQVTMNMIEGKEGKHIAELTKEFLIKYTIQIAKSSKEDYLSFIGLADSISDAEEQFLARIKELFNS